MCAVCGDEVGEDEAHWIHEADCPNGHADVLKWTCICDLWAHPECCPMCR